MYKLLSTFSKRISLTLVIVMQVLLSYAGSDGFYRYSSTVSSYPTGCGTVYGSYDMDASEITFVDVCKLEDFTAHNPDETLYVWANPSDGYQLTGWYRAADGKPGELLAPAVSCMYQQAGLVKPQYPHTRIMYSLMSDFSETEFPDGYVTESHNYILGTFGKVSVDVSIDNLKSFMESEGEVIDIEGDILFFSKILFNLMEINSSNPVNDSGDKITISTKKRGALDNSSFKFLYWTDSAGNRYDNNTLDITVNKLDTYTAHYTAIKGTDSEVSLGDANSDGVVNIADAVLVVNHYLGTSDTSIDISAADANEDGVVNVQDAITITNMYLNSGKMNVYRQNK